MNQPVLLPRIQKEEDNLFVQGSRVLALHDCEPDDKTALAFLYNTIPKLVPMFLLTVSPAPEKHTKEITNLLELLKSKNHEENRELIIETGAQYGKQIEGNFKEPENQEYLEKLNKFIMDAPDNSVIVYMLTTCYSLMKHWKDEWAAKIRIVFNMGGEGVPREEKDGKIAKTLGFNYRVGTEYIDAFMTKIPVEKRIILETNVYNPEFKRKYDGVVSICPRTFSNFSAALMESYIEMNPFVKSLVETNGVWVDKLLSDWKDGEKFYPDKRMKHWYFGPADILLAVCSLESSSYVLKERELEVGEKKYTIRSMTKINFELIDAMLTRFIYSIDPVRKITEIQTDVSIKRPKIEGGIPMSLLASLFSQE